MNWIPITDRWPEENVSVLVATDIDVAMARWYLDLDGIEAGQRMWKPVGRGAYGWINDVTHWMPLPEMPQVVADYGHTINLGTEEELKRAIKDDVFDQMFIGLMKRALEMRMAVALRCIKQASPPPQTCPGDSTSTA